MRRSRPGPLRRRSGRSAGRIASVAQQAREGTRAHEGKRASVGTQVETRAAGKKRRTRTRAPLARGIFAGR